MQSNRIRSLVIALLVTALAAPAVAGERQRQKLRAAADVYRELMEVPERKVPNRLLREARCLAVIPGVIKGAFIWGGRHGRGVLTCRRGGGWSAPIFVNLSGGSVGFQVGGQASDFVLFFVTDRSVHSLLDSEFTFGGDASVSAGPLGRTAEAATDLKLKAEIYSYAKSRGLFAGISLEGARLAPNQKWIRAYYGERLWPEDILFEGAVRDSGPAAREFLSALP